MLFLPKKKKKFLKKKINRLHILPLWVALAGIGFSLALMFAGILFVFFNLHAQRAALRDVQVELLVDCVSRHIVVNKFEQPIVAIVLDPAALKQNNPNFYGLASIGDRLLIWSDQVILYSVRYDVILSVLPLWDVSAQPVNTQAAVQDKELVKLEVRNGTFSPGLAKKFADTLKSQGYKTTNPRDAVDKPYEKTLIVNLSGQEYAETVQHLINLTGGTIQTTLPAETNVKADILIVLGNDFKP
jgi:hypothetical protein